MEVLYKDRPIYKAKLPFETKQDFEMDLATGRQRYGWLFSHADEFELFWMLPLDDKQRHQLLSVLMAEKTTSLEVSNCKGRSETPGDHRARCIPCCTLYKPSIAEPYY